LPSQFPDTQSRFPHHTDRDAISKLRSHLNTIYLENLLLESNQDGYDQASRCGELQARKCTRCAAIQADGNLHRYTCKQRMCPRCMGTLAREALWGRANNKKKKAKNWKKELLKIEANLTVFVFNLGSYYIGDKPAYWGAKAREVISQAYKWLERLGRLKGCPDTFKTSFSGFRADLHQGYLSLDLVLLGPNAFGAVAYLRGYFEQATEQEVDVETIPCHSVDEAINTFGNLMSSMAIYGTHDECQALMAAFKGRRLIHPRGRFQGKDAPVQCGDVSNTPGDLLETSPHPDQGGGEANIPHPCHECGAATVPVGLVNGNWKRVKGQHSGQLFWLLVEDSPPVRRG
jgi:hypothetical protein